MTQNHDIIIFGGGIAGLFIADRLRCAGYNLILIEKDKLGGGQTLASQGMIHGGQKYALAATSFGHATSIAAMPARWDACFEGRGDVDLSGVTFLSDSQVMFPAGSFLSGLTVLAAAIAVNGRTCRLKRGEFPAVLKRGPVYEMREKVVDTKSLVEALAQNLKGRIFQGEVQEILPDGQVVVSGVSLRAQAVIFTAGTGNETALKLLRIKERHTQRRPLRQIMVRPMDQLLYGHGICGRTKPRVTVTSHPLGHPLADGRYVWYIGGNVAEKSAGLSEEEALRFAKKEMEDIFPHVGWEKKEWAHWYVDRAEPLDAEGRLPAGPRIRKIGKILIGWPVKMTFVPALADSILSRLQQDGIAPSARTALPALPEASIGLYPWEEAVWRHL